MSQIIKSLVRTTVRLTARGLRSGPHITRYAMYEALRRYAPVVRNDGRTLAVSHSRPLCEVLGIAPASVLEANYPECDLLSLPFEDGTFANVVTDQVLEHVNDPRTAIAESVRVLVPGGVAIHTTCFINPIHDAPADYWRFTPEALHLLCRDYEIVGVGGWGNRLVWLVDALGMRFDPIPHATWHPLHKIATRDDPAWPIVTWVVLRRPG
ncbi:MAG: methyltransferase domain-containing protein [Myxococcales bacterium]|nr:methyltransferase domain-containing protein [Myxococcales bacterium]MCB9581524.1 methyltransferase domain-containing protein [Polyangiaceae bacterium]